MIPRFPEFAPLSVDIAEEYQKYIKPYPPYADFNLTNRISWEVGGQTAVSLLNNNLVLRLPNYTHGGSRITLLGKHKLRQTVAILLDSFWPGDTAPQLNLVPECVIRQLPPMQSWLAEEDVDNHDHVLSVSRLTDMTGSDLRHFRRGIHAFQRDYGQTAAFHQLDTTCPLTQETMIQTFHQREDAKAANDSTLECAALKKLLGAAKPGQFLAYGISIRGVLRAFIICEPMNETWVIGHFWKADTAFSGIYSYLMHRTARCLQKLHFEYMNTQQDLGIKGLRAFKESLAPIMQLRKYTVRQVVRHRAATAPRGTQPHLPVHPAL